MSSAAVNPAQTIQARARSARPQLQCIQVMRALCAYAVISGHCMSGLLRTRVSLGVDIFFVISGFLVWILTRNRRLHPVEFMFNRVSRIAPLYWIATLLVAGVAV